MEGSSRALPTWGTRAPSPSPNPNLGGSKVVSWLECYSFFQVIILNLLVLERKFDFFLLWFDYFITIQFNTIKPYYLSATVLD